MPTPYDIIAGLWLAAWPMWGTVVVPPMPPAEPAAARATTGAGAGPSALLELNDEALLDRVKAEPAALGSLSIGSPGSAILLNSVRMPAGPYWAIAPNADAWGTTETIAAIQTAIGKVHEIYPDAPPLTIGDISDANGGHLKRHESHQGGRDADLGFFYKNGRDQWFTPGTAANFDLPRNWALVRALVVCTDVEAILLDLRIQRLLYQYALSTGEDKEWLDRVFQVGRGSAQAVVRHVVGHRTHYHVRFYNAVAQELGRRAHPMLVALKVVSPPVFTVKHVALAGQTLGTIARRYGTTVGAIMRANGLTSSQIRAGKAYRIPMRTAAPAAQPFVLPRRVLPDHTPDLFAAVPWPTAESLYGRPTGDGR